MAHSSVVSITLPGESPSFAPPASFDGEDVYQLIKRGEINPHEVETVGGHAVEVSVLWKSSILHVAHIEDGKSFSLTARDPKMAPTGKVMGAFWGVGSALMLAGVAMSDPQHAERNGSLVVGGVGALTSLVGTGVGIGMHRRNDEAKGSTSHFIVGTELLGGAGEMPVVMNNGGTRFLFLPNATGEVELQGVKRSLEDLKAQGHARPSSAVPGGFEVNIQPEGRYKQEVGGLTIIARVVAPGRVVAGHVKRDGALVGALAGSGVLVAAAMMTLHLAGSDGSSFLSATSDDQRLAELRAFIQRQQDREPEPVAQPEAAAAAAPGGTGTRAAGAEGALGRRDAPVRSAHYAIRNNGTPPHLSAAQAREAVAQRITVFTALGAPGAMAGGSSGVVGPFGGMTESGPDAQNAQGNMTGDVVGDAFGAGGLGNLGTGFGGGAWGEGTIGQGNINTMGHGSGTGPGQSYGSSAGNHLAHRGTGGPITHAYTPVVSGLLSQEAIRRVVIRNLGQVNHCHEQGLALNSNATGRITVRFVIGGSGAVMGSGIADSSYPVASVGDCIANAVRRWQFPSPDGGGVVTVNYPFSLQPPNQ